MSRFYSILLLLLVLLLISFLLLDRVNNRKQNEHFDNHEKVRIKYHIFTDFVPDINGKKYYNYLPERHITQPLNNEIGSNGDVELPPVDGCGNTFSRFDPVIEKESIFDNLSLYFTNQQEKYNVYEGVENEINSTALILHSLSKNSLSDYTTRKVLQFVLLNTLNNYKLDNDSREIIHIVILPFVLKDANVIKMYYYDKEIYFVGLYTPLDNSKFFKTYPRWHNNKESVDKIKQSMFGDVDTILSVSSLDDRYSGVNDKCKFLTPHCNAGVDCERYNNLMIENIYNMNRQISMYNNYLQVQQSIQNNNPSMRNPNCPDTENPPPANANAKFSFL